MAITITRTKILIPRRRKDLLSRHRLNILLDDLLDYKLLLITAPAGYGKTSLLIDWVQQNSIPVCWYALDPLDNDLTRFISYLIASIARVFPSFGWQSQASLENYDNSELNVEHILTAIVNDAYENIKEHFVLILDDFHTIDGSDKINRFVNRFINEIDENCHVIIASRTLLSLPDLPLMVARSMVKGLSYEELAFRGDEIQDLLLQNYKQSIDDDVAAKLQNESEGWITGLLLSAQTMWEGMDDRVQVVRASGVGLYDYLAQQVLDQQSPMIRDFLLQTSLLEEFDADLCNEVIGEAPGDLEWKDILGEVLQNNLFVLPLEDKDTWLRYHHLFRDFLQDRISREDPQLVKSILTRIALVYTQKETWERAYDIYQRLDDQEKISELITTAGTSMLKDRRINVLKAWLDRLSKDRIAQNPSLLSLQGSLDILFGQVARGISRLDQAEELFDNSDEKRQLAILLLRRSTGHGFMGNYQEVLTDVDRALSIVDGEKEHKVVFAEAKRAKGLGYYWLGDLSNAVTYLEEALNLYKALSNPQNEALIHVDLGLAYMDSGELPDALAHYEKALSYWHQTGNIARKVTVLNNIGVLHHLQGEYDQASKNLNDTLVLARKSGNIRIEGYALASIGDLYSDLDAYESASEAFRLARDISIRINNQRLLVYSYLAEALVYCKKGELGRSDILLNDIADLITESDSKYEKGLYGRICGQVALEKGYVAFAIMCLEDAKECFESGGQDTERIQVYLELARAYYQLNQYDQGYSYLELGLRLAQGTGSYHTLLTGSRNATAFLLDERIPSEIKDSANQLAHKVNELITKIPEYRRLLRRQKLVISIEKTSRISIRALGRIQISIDSEPITAPEWRVQFAVRELFFLLLAKPDGLSKEEIGLVLWPDSSTQQLKIQFKNAIYRLRRAVGKEIIIYETKLDVYRFNWSVDYEYDVESFRKHIARANDVTGLERFSSYKDAVKIYQGPYLPDGDGVWIIPEREELWLMYLNARLILAKHALEMREYNAALVHIHQILSQDKCQEEAHRLAMRIHAALGNQADLIRQYEVCKTALMSDYSITPSKKTEDLYLKLLVE